MQTSGFSTLAIALIFFCTNSVHAQNLTVEGSVGIGTDTPTEKLQVEDGFIRIVNNSPFLRLQSTEDQNAGMEFLNSAGDPGGLIFYSFPSNEIVFMNQGAQHMFIEDNGEVGIGTNEPQSKLHITGGSDVNSTDGGYLINGSLTGTNLGIDNNEIQARSDGDASILYINPEGGDISMARDGGSVGIGRLPISNVSLAIENLEEDNVALRVETSDSQENGVYFTSARFSNTGTNGTALDVPIGIARKAGGGSWAGTSDARTKRDVKPYAEGLDILKAIDPVWYTYNGKGDTPEGHRFVGVIAQELDKVAQHMVIPGQDGYMAVDPSAFTYMLINAVQELDKDNKGKDEQIQAQNKKIEALEARLTKIEALLQGQSSMENTVSHSTTTLTNARLEQNQPNPFNGSTTVPYFIPEGVQKAELRVTDLQGRVIKSETILARGKGQTTFDTAALSSGTYQYSLFLDGQLLETKQMVLSKH